MIESTLRLLVRIAQQIPCNACQALIRIKGALVRFTMQDIVYIAEVI